MKMPACRNDASRKYKGDEPSPKGLGWCAHAEKEGTKKTGGDGKQWMVRTDTNGRRSWKPDLGITIRSGRMSDGTIVSWTIGHKPELYDGEDNLPLTRSHWDAVYSPSKMVLRLDRGSPLAALDVVIPGPVTVRKVFAAMQRFYATKLTSKDYDILETEFQDWNVGKTMRDFKTQIKTYGDSKGDSTAFGGFNKWGNVFSPVWDS